MTLLGSHSPLLRLANAERGLARRPVPRGPEERLRELVALGVDGILTDEPALLRGIVGAKAGRPEEVEAPR